MKRLFVLCAALLFCFFAAGTSSAFAQTEPSGSPDANAEEPSSENKTEEDSADIQSDVVYKINQPGDYEIGRASCRERV